MNLHSVTPSDLKKFQIERYSEMLLNPRSENHRKYLKNELKRLQNVEDNYSDRTTDSSNNSFYQSLEVVQKRSERLC